MWDFRRNILSKPIRPPAMRAERLEARDMPSASPVVTNFNAFHDDLLPVGLPDNNTVSTNGRFILGTNPAAGSSELDRLDRSVSPASSMVVPTGLATLPFRNAAISADGSTVAFIDANQNVYVTSIDNSTGQFGTPTLVPDPIPPYLSVYTVHTLALSQNGQEVAYYLDNTTNFGTSFAELHIYDRPTGTLTKSYGLDQPVEFLDDGISLLEGTATFHDHYGGPHYGTADILGANGTTVPFAPGNYSVPTPFPGAPAGIVYKGLDTPFASGDGTVLAYTSSAYEAITPVISPPLRDDVFISTGPGQVTPITSGVNLVNPKLGEMAQSRVLGMSDDGRYTLFITNLALSPRDTGINTFDYYVYDRQLGKSIFLDVGAASIDAVGSISRDGSAVVVTTPDNLTSQTTGTDIKTYALGQFANRKVTPSISDITVIAGGLTIPEHLPKLSTIATFGATSSNGYPLTYSLLKTGDGAFGLDGQTLFVADASRLNFNVNAVISIRVLVQDGYGGQAEQEFQVQLTQVVAPPVQQSTLVLNGTSVSAFAPEGSFVGQLSVTNPGNHTYTYHLEDPAGGRFRLDGDRLIASNEYQLSHSPDTVTIKVLAVDELGNHIEQTFTIAIADQLVFNLGGRIDPHTLEVGFNNAEGTRRLLAEGRLRLYDTATGTDQWVNVQAVQVGTTIRVYLPNANDTYRLDLDVNGDWVFEASQYG